MHEEIRFYRSGDGYGFLSNLYPCRVLYKGKVFKSSEHAYQCQKPNKPEIAEWVKAAPYPRLAASVGHHLATYDIRDDWMFEKVSIMEGVVWAKFEQNPELAKLLLKTGDSILIENSKTDKFWGSGRDDLGKNMLGEILTETREKLRLKGVSR